MTKLQIALDFFELDKALYVAKEAARAGVDLIEIGTPLIHSAGLKRAITSIKDSGIKQEIVADLKLVDAGYATAKFAFSLGANYVTVLADASEETIKGVVKAAREEGGFVIADTILSKNPGETTAKIVEYDVDYILLHLGIDVQSKVTLEKYISAFVDKIPKEKLVLAGGINLTSIKQILKYNPAIVIVGKAITRSADPYKTTKNFLEIIRG